MWRGGGAPPPPPPPATRPFFPPPPADPPPPPPPPPPRQPTGRDHRPGVADPDGRLAASGRRGDLGPAVAGVVPYGVVDQVRHQAFRQPRIPHRRGLREPGLDVDAPALRFLAADRDHVPGDRG